RELRIGPSLLDIAFWREGDRSRWDVRRVVSSPHTPLAAAIQVLQDPEYPGA
nr:hypothetical protein [Ktedonobacterales bacterium]